MRDAVDKAYKEAMAAAAEVTAEARKLTAESAGVLTENEKEILERKQRNARAVEIRATWGPTHTVEEKQALLDHLEKEGVADSTVYTSLEASTAQLRGSDMTADKFEEQKRAEEEKLRLAEEKENYKLVIEGGNGKDLAGGFILKTGTGSLGETEVNTLAGQIGADIDAYDLALSRNRQPDETGIAQGVTPQQAYLGGYYEKALAYPGVYIKDTKPGIQGAFRGGTEYDPLLFKSVLNKSFAREGQQITDNEELVQFLLSGLVIADRTKIPTVINGMKTTTTVSPEHLAKLEAKAKLSVLSEKDFQALLKENGIAYDANIDKNILMNRLIDKSQ
jgi:hypothetical protein